MDTDIDKSDQQNNIDLTTKTADIEFDTDQVLIDIDIDFANGSLQKTISHSQEDQDPFVQRPWTDIVTTLSATNSNFTRRITTVSRSTTNDLSTKTPSRNVEKEQRKNLVIIQNNIIIFC